MADRKNEKKKSFKTSDAQSFEPLCSHPECHEVSNYTIHIRVNKIN